MEINADTLSNFIREQDGNNKLGAGALAELICEHFVMTRKPTYKLRSEVVKELREKTGQSMQLCRSALVRADGDMDKAAEIVHDFGNMAYRKA